MYPIVGTSPIDWFLPRDFKSSLWEE